MRARKIERRMRGKEERWKESKMKEKKEKMTDGN